jgi:hypothetical protein
VNTNIIDIHFIWISIAQSASSPLHGLSTTNIEKCEFDIYSLLTTCEYQDLVNHLSENHYYKGITNIEQDVKAVREEEYLRQE